MPDAEMQTIPVAGGVDMTFREPIGVVGVITPWNFPLTIASWKIAPALAAGNAVVHKPSELTPLTALELQYIAAKAGLPEGLLTVLVGTGEEVGRRLVEHPGVGKIAFTGSTAVGRGIAARAAQQVKRVTLELGGKSPSIVFADADLRSAAHGLAGAVFGNSGQDCCARSRVFVERAALREFLDLLEDTVRSLKVGDPLDAATVTAFTDETFGPVVAITRFDSEDTAIELANDTRYGLGATVWSEDTERAHAIARRIDSGAVSVNTLVASDPRLPFGGIKRSGYGRELAAVGLHEFTNIRTYKIA